MIHDKVKVFGRVYAALEKLNGLKARIKKKLQDLEPIHKKLEKQVQVFLLKIQGMKEKRMDSLDLGAIYKGMKAKVSRLVTLLAKLLN